MDTETLAYAAGILDAEGSICIVSASRNSRFPTFYIAANIANTHQSTIVWLRDAFACGYLNSPKPTSAKHRPIYIWQIQSNAAAHFLRMICPYLVVKREQAEVALTFYDYHRETAHHGNEETVMRKDAYRQRIKELNNRPRESGIPMPTAPANANLAYLAGFFDGEGSVKIVMRNSRMKTRGRGFPLYGLVASIGNSDRHILQWYQSLFSGSIAEMHTNTAIKQMWMWRLGGDGAQMFLTTILPYLRIKREQAILGIEFQDYHRAHWQAVHAVCTPEVLACKEEYRQRISQLALYAQTIKPLPERFNTLTPRPTASPPDVPTCA